MSDGQVIEFVNLTKQYGSVTAVDNISARINPGVVTGFLGQNGAGKTTTLKMLLGQVRPSSGTALIGGVSISDISQPMRTIGAVMENQTFRPRRTATRVLTIAARANGIPLERIGKMLKLVGLTEDADNRVGTYSLGMRQRLSVAIALLGDPGVVVLDEPANGLDPEGIRWMRLLMRRLADDGKTVLVSSHVLSEIEQVADEVLVAANGKLMFSGAVSALADPAGGAVVVDAADRAGLIAALRDAGLQAEDLRSGLTVRGSDAKRVGEVASAAGIALSTLVQRGPTLEDVFLELINGRLSPATATADAAAETDAATDADAVTDDAAAETDAVDTDAALADDAPADDAATDEPVADDAVADAAADDADATDDSGNDAAGAAVGAAAVLGGAASAIALTADDEPTDLDDTWDRSDIDAAVREAHGTTPETIAAETHADVDALVADAEDVDADSDADADADADTDDVDADAAGDPDAEADAGSDTEDNDETDADSTDAETDAEVATDADADGDAEAEGDAETEDDADSDADTDDVDADADAESEADNVDTEADADGESDSAEDSDTEGESDSEGDAAAELDADAEGDADSTFEGDAETVDSEGSNDADANDDSVITGVPEFAAAPDGVEDSDDTELDSGLENNATYPEPDSDTDTDSDEPFADTLDSPEDFTPVVHSSDPGDDDDLDDEQSITTPPIYTSAPRRATYTPPWLQPVTPPAPVEPLTDADDDPRAERVTSMLAAAAMAYYGGQDSTSDDADNADSYDTAAIQIQPAADSDADADAEAEERDLDQTWDEAYDSDPTSDEDESNR